MTLTVSILSAIDERIRRSPVTNRTTDVGEVVSVSTDRLRAMVKLDRATLATPVKVAGNALCRPGDKVGLVKYGPDGEWYVANILSRVVGPDHAVYGAIGVAGTTTGASPANLPGNPSVTWTKHFDATPTAMFVSFSLYTSAAAGVAGSLGFTDAAGQTIYRVFEWEPSTFADRAHFSAWRTIPDAVTATPLPAGDYTVNLMWHRTTGAGVLNGSADDWVSAFVLEGGT